MTAVGARLRSSVSTSFLSYVSAMRLLCFQAKRFWWKPFERDAARRGRRRRGESRCATRWSRSCTSSAPTSSPSASASVFRQTLKHLKWLANKRELRTVVLHSFTHLGGDGAEPAAGARAARAPRRAPARERLHAARHAVRLVQRVGSRRCTARASPRSGSRYERRRLGSASSAPSSRCRRCPRLVAHREDVARDKRRQFRDWDVLGPAGPRLRRSRGRALLDRRPRARRARRQPHRPHLHRRSQRRLALRSAARHRLRQPADLDAARRRPGAARRLRHRRSARCAPPANKPTAEEIANCRPYLLERAAPAHAGCASSSRSAASPWTASCAPGRPPGRAVPSPRPRFGHAAECALDDARDAALLVPPEPAEHLHRPADAADAGGRLQPRPRADLVARPGVRRQAALGGQVTADVDAVTALTSTKSGSTMHHAPTDHSAPPRSTPHVASRRARCLLNFPPNLATTNQLQTGRGAAW